MIQPLGTDQHGFVPATVRDAEESHGGPRHLWATQESPDTRCSLGAFSAAGVRSGVPGGGTPSSLVDALPRALGFPSLAPDCNDISKQVCSPWS